jgi:hypothetical protein
MTHPGPARDFDFEIGRWSVRHQRLRQRLAGSTDREAFSGTCEMRLIPGGSGNIEDSLPHLPAGPCRAAALRGFDAARGTWAIWWLDGRNVNAMDPPVIGRFDKGVGTFLGAGMPNGRPIRVRFLWPDTAAPSPRREQAVSADGGATWETNGRMRFTRLAV